jgi:hypothetical protein
LHFGLAGHNRINRIRVHWPAIGKRRAHVDVLENVNVDRVMRIEERE